MKNTLPITVSTLNVRNSSPSNPENQTDFIRGLLYHDFRWRCAWKNRKDRMVKSLLSTNSDIIGLQEVLSDQYDFLSTSLTHEYNIVGVGRDDGKRKGEFAPIAFRKDKFECLDWNTFWLSETKDIIGSKFSGACCVRICTWIRLKLKYVDDAPHIIIANAHLDHKSERARTFGCKIIRDTMYQLLKEGDGLIILGDFNFQRPEEEGYLQLLNSFVADPSLKFPNLCDSYHDYASKDSCSASDVERHGITFHNFGRSTVGLRLDFIFYLPRNGAVDIEVIESTVEKDGDIETKFFISDHYILKSKFSIKYSL